MEQQGKLKFDFIPSILIVDDNQVSRLMLTNILHKEGFIVFEATNGREGREIAEIALPDLVLMDINMPEEDGLTACKKMKANPTFSELPVVFISALEDIDSKIEGFKAGGVDYVTKPYNPAEVLARVRLHIRLSHAYRSMVSAHLNQLKSLTQTQQMLLIQPTDLPEANFAVNYQPAQEAGGDFYDVLRAGEGIFDYLIADISGHDIGTSLATAALKALLHQNVEMLYTPEENLNLLNRHLRPVLSEDQFVTLIYARINKGRNTLTLLNAGNPPAILIHHSSGIEIVEQVSDPLGIFDQVFLESREIHIDKRDRVIIYSDGMIEQDRCGMKTRHQGMKDLVELCEETRNLELTEAIVTITQKLLPDPNMLVDDSVLLAFEYEGTTR